MLFNNIYVLINIKEYLLNHFHDTAIWSGFQAESGGWKLSIREALLQMLPEAAAIAPISNIVVGSRCPRST